MSQEPPSRRIKSLSPQGLQSMTPAIEKGECMLLDVRERTEFEAEHIPLAELIPLSETERFNDLERDRSLIIYCRTGNRSQKVARMLNDMGFKDIYVLEGGINNWKSFMAGSNPGGTRP